MEEKKRITLHIAGQMLSIVTDDDEETVRAIERELNERIAEFGRHSPRMATKEGRMSAIILCAVESMSTERAQRVRLERAQELEQQLERVQDFEQQRTRLEQRIGELERQVEDAEQRAEHAEQSAKRAQHAGAPSDRDSAAHEPKYRALLEDYEKLSARLAALTGSTPDERGAEEKREAAKDLLLAKKARL